jgi:hypothetical protein
MMERQARGNRGGNTFGAVPGLKLALFQNFLTGIPGNSPYC